jgi:hypothetical protein
MTPGEYEAVGIGFKMKQDMLMRRDAWKLTWICNPHYKARLNPKKILPKDFDKPERIEAEKPTADQVSYLNSVLDKGPNRSQKDIQAEQTIKQIMEKREKFGG